MKVRRDSNFEYQNETNGTLRIEVREHTSYKGVKGQLSMSYYKCSCIYHIKELKAFFNFFYENPLKTCY